MYLPIDLSLVSNIFICYQWVNILHSFACSTHLIIRHFLIYNSLASPPLIFCAYFIIYLETPNCSDHSEYFSRLSGETDGRIFSTADKKSWKHTISLVKKEKKRKKSKIKKTNKNLILEEFEFSFECIVYLLSQLVDGHLLPSLSTKRLGPILV